MAKTLTIYDSYCRKIFRVTTEIVVFRKNIILLEFSSLTIVVNLEHFITSKHGGHGFLEVKDRSHTRKAIKEKSNPRGDERTEETV